MKKSQLVVFGPLALVGAIGLVAACSSDDVARVDESDGGPAADAYTPGSDANVPPAPDAGVPDAAVSGGRVYLANAVTSIKAAFRVCALSSTSTDEPGLSDVVDGPALPNSASGIGPGEITRVDIPGGSFTGRSLRLAIFYVAALDAFGLSDKGCKEIVSNIKSDAGTGNLLDGIDFELSLTALPRTHFKDSGSYLLLGVGCPRATPLDMAEGECPGGVDGTYDGKTNYFRQIAYELDTSPASADKNRVQFLHATESTNILLRFSGFPELLVGGVRYGDPDGGATRSEPIIGVGGDAGYYADKGAQPFIESSGPLQPAPGTEVSDLRTMFGFEYNEAAPDRVPRVRPVSEIDGLSGGFKVADVQPGKAYTFVAIGSPFHDRTFADGGLNPGFLHFALLPNE